LKDKQGLSDEELARKTADLKEDQLQNAEALKEMSEEGMKNLREALKNPTLSEDILKEWTKTMREMQNISGKPMQKAAKSLEQAGKQPKGKDKDLADAQETEKDILQDLQQMQKRVNKGLDDMQALSLAQRLRKMGAGQKEIHTEISKVVGETIGMTPEELTQRHQKQNAFLAEQQVDARERSRELQGEISRFFERTRKPSYGQVSKEMAEARTPDEMDRVRTLIESNISMQAMDALMLWSDRFDAWADLLEPKKLDAGSANQGGAAGEPPEEDNALKHLMALLRVREGQVNLRERTRMLEKNHGDETVYKESAGKLRENESKLLDNLDAVQQENDDTELVPALRDSSRAMQLVDSLLAKPETGDPTMSAHKKALESLSDAINLLNEKAQKQNNSGQSTQQGEEMAFLMQMMQQQNPKPGMQGGMTPGMNFNGGTTEMPATAQNGNATGKADAARTARKAGGSTASLPAEFRDALENYYKAIEKGAQ
jgi:aryl carrier-like protein